MSGSTNKEKHMSLKEALLSMAGDEDDNGEPNPPTGDSDDGRDYDN